MSSSKRRATKIERPRSVKKKRNAPPERRGVLVQGTSVGSLGHTGLASLRVKEIDALRSEVERTGKSMLPRWNADPEDVQKSVAQLVLALVEFLRKLLERQAIRRMEAETLAPDEIERIGLALMRLEETVHDLAARFGLSPDELNLDLGPLGRLT